LNQNEDNKNNQAKPKGQEHVHELQGSVDTAEQNDPHAHRFCTVTGEVIPFGANDHIHEVVFLTDYHEDHYHEFRGKTGGVIQVNDRHIHYIEGVTSVEDNHSHGFKAATMINNPAWEKQRTAYYEDEYPYTGQYQYENDDLYDEGYYQYREDNYHRY
jgi:hypothetical protein